MIKVTRNHKNLVKSDIKVMKVTTKYTKYKSAKIFLTIMHTFLVASHARPVAVWVKYINSGA